MLKSLLASVAALLLLAQAGLAQGPVVLFDEAHGQRFLVSQSGDYGLSGLGAAFTSAGFELKTATAPITAQDLAGVNVLVSSGGFETFTDAEAKAIVDFIGGGGSFVAMLHIAPPYVKLLVGIEAVPSRGVLYETENVVGIDSNTFNVVNLEKHPLFEGITSFTLRGTWAVINRDKNSQIIAYTSPNAWLDVNHNKLRDPQVETFGKFGVVVAGKKGAGQFVVFGDDAVFQDKFLEGNNKILAQNLANWLK